MSDSRFNLYDFFAYIIPAYVFLVGAATLVVSPSRLLEALQDAEPYKYVLSVASILAAYAFGHLLSELASLVEERLLVARWLGYPSENLFAGTRKRPVLFRQYRRSYDGAFIEDWKRTYESVFKRPVDHHTAFLDAFHMVKESSEPTRQRLQTFIAVYGFCRNLAMALGLLVLCTLVRALLTQDLTMIPVALGTGIVSIGFFARYLKFFRHFADEVFRGFYILQKRLP